MLYHWAIPPQNNHTIFCKFSIWKVTTRLKSHIWIINHCTNKIWSQQSVFWLVNMLYLCYSGSTYNTPCTPDLNWGLLDLQGYALHLRYTPVIYCPPLLTHSLRKGHRDKKSPRKKKLVNPFVCFLWLAIVDMDTELLVLTSLTGCAIELLPKLKHKI